MYGTPEALEEAKEYLEIALSTKDQITSLNSEIEDLSRKTEQLYQEGNIYDEEQYNDY